MHSPLQILLTNQKKNLQIDQSKNTLKHLQREMDRILSALFYSYCSSNIKQR